MAEVPSRQYFEDRASETGFLVSNLEKAYRIMQIAKETDAFDTEGYIAIRGGTALNFCYLNVPRLSIDIDLVYVRNFEKKAMEQDRVRIRAGLDRIFVFLRYSVEVRTTYALDQYFLTYRSWAGNPERIKVEVNYLSARVPILKIARRKMASLFETDQHEVAVLATEELCGSKIKALIERGSTRDLFDTYNIAQNIASIDFDTLKRVAIFYCCLELKSDFRGWISPDPFGGMDDKTIYRELRPLLRRNTVLPLKEAKELVNPLISKVFTLGGEEEEFVKAFYRLNYRPDILFASNPVLKYHPGAEWRLRMLARKSR